MTVKEYAKSKGVSVQSVYDKLKRSTLGFQVIDGVKHIVESDSDLMAFNDVVSTVKSKEDKELERAFKQLERARRKHLKFKHKYELATVKLKSMETLLASKDEEIATLKNSLNMIGGLVSKKLLQETPVEEDVIDLVPSKKKQRKKRKK